MNGDLEKLVDELESFDSSIRHLPIAEQERLRKNRRDSMDKKANQAKKIAMIGLVFMIPAVVWFACTWYNNTVYENSLAIILTMTLSPSAMLLADFLFKKYN